MSYGAQCSPPVGETASLLVTVLQSFICQVYKLTDIKYYGISFSAAPTIATNYNKIETLARLRLNKNT